MSGRPLNGGFQPAGVQSKVVRGALCEVESHHGNLMTRKIRRGVSDLTAVPRRLDGDVKPQCVNDKAGIIDTTCRYIVQGEHHLTDVGPGPIHQARDVYPVRRVVDVIHVPLGVGEGLEQIKSVAVLH